MYYYKTQLINSVYIFKEFTYANSHSKRLMMRLNSFWHFSNISMFVKTFVRSSTKTGWFQSQSLPNSTSCWNHICYYGVNLRC